MQIAYFDCFSGISGDMTLAALIDAGADLAAIQAAIASMDLGAVRLSVTNTQRHGFRGKLLSIEQPREHAHRFLRDIHTHIRRGRFSVRAKDLAMRFFERIARAEAKVHGTTIDRVQFHEVGAIDSIVDMVGVAVAWDLLGIEKAYASAVPTGSGLIRIAHGTVSVPAPATAELLMGVPIAPTQIQMEMTTPTGAAILTELVSDFGPMPSIQVGRIGYGAGNKDVPDRPNLLRLLIGNALGSPTKPVHHNSDHIVVLECNLDDIPGEQIGFAIESLWKAGALDVFTSSIQMKKNRPGTLLTVLAKPDDRQSLEAILFQHTGTLGIRYRRQARTVLPRTAIEVPTPWGIVLGKVSKLPSGEEDFSPEYEDCARIARTFGLRLIDVTQKVHESYRIDLRPTPRISTSNQAASNQAASPRVESVNAVFMQAAFEDEFGTDSMKPKGLESPTQTPELPQHEKSIESGLESEGPNEFYRWDSSPWSVERIAPLPPPKNPSEFPIPDHPAHHDPAQHLRDKP